jgi:hypothetical protein
MDGSADLRENNKVYRTVSHESRSVDPDWKNCRLLQKIEGYDLYDT